MSESSKQVGWMQKLNEIPFSEWEKATVTNRNGSQDTKGHIRGYYIAIEWKKDNDKEPRPLQLYRISQTNKKGGFSFWSSDWKDARDKLSKFAESKGFGLYDKD